MNRKSLLTFPAALAVAAAVFTGSAAARPDIVEGEVGPASAVALSVGGTNLTSLKAGVAYQFHVRDYSALNDLRIVGPSFNRVIYTGWYTGTGTTTVTLKLKKGAYQYSVGPTFGSLNGIFIVR
jgi:hypothetical protein